MNRDELHQVLDEYSAIRIRSEWEARRAAIKRFLLNLLTLIEILAVLGMLAAIICGAPGG